MTSSIQTILLTIDVEDWFQVENFREFIRPSEWDTFPARVVENTVRILDLFDRFKAEKSVKATFFTLGWVAEKWPELVREICRRGHEIASHGYGHMMCSTISLNDLSADLIRSKNTIENISGVEIRGYRAPSFSISDAALQAVMMAGYKYDSSYNSFSHNKRYGNLTTNGKEQNGIAIRMAPNFYELPISNLTFRKHTIPWGGGGYFRLLPFFLFKSGVKQILRRQGNYMFYFHPWEIDGDQPRVESAKKLSKFRHYLNIDRTYERIGKLISTFKDCEFLTCNQYLRKQC
jgi:polysaccharide deacetylase family protein (PEP-CTERM system associated)